MPGAMTHSEASSAEGVALQAVWEGGSCGGSIKQGKAACKLDPQLQFADVFRLVERLRQRQPVRGQKSLATTASAVTRRNQLRRQVTQELLAGADDWLSELQQLYAEVRIVKKERKWHMPPSLPPCAHPPAF